MSQAKFPKAIFVTIGKDGNSYYLNACETETEAAECIEQDIATYKLVTIRKGKLVPQFRT